MRRTRHNIYAKLTTPRYIVRQDMFRQVIECERIEIGADPRAAVAAAVLRLEANGWTFECDMAWGFAFLCRGGERTLLTLTERDPADEVPQSFNPHR